MELCVSWRHRDEVRRKIGLSAKRKEIVADEVGGDDECIPSGRFTMGDWGGGTIY